MVYLIAFFIGLVPYLVFLAHERREVISRDREDD